MVAWNANLPANWNEGCEWFRTPYAFKHLSHTAASAKSFEDAVKEFAKRGHHVTSSSIEMWFGDRWVKEAELV
jgi:hypothetical protein